MKGWRGSGDDKLVPEEFSKKMTVLQSLLLGAKLSFKSIQV